MKWFVNQLPFYQYSLEQSHLVQLIRIVALKSMSTTGDIERANTRAVPVPKSSGASAGARQAQRYGKALFRRMIRLAKERNHKLIVVTTGWHKFAPADANEPTVAFMAIAEDFFRENGIALHDISRAVHGHAGFGASNISIVNDGHPNEQGAQIIADEAWRALVSYLQKSIAQMFGERSVGTSEVLRGNRFGLESVLQASPECRRCETVRKMKVAIACLFARATTQNRFT